MVSGRHSFCLLSKQSISLINAGAYWFLIKLSASIAVVSSIGMRQQDAFFKRVKQNFRIVFKNEFTFKGFADYFTRRIDVEALMLEQVF